MQTGLATLSSHSQRRSEGINHFGWLNARHLPEEPSLVLVAQISQLNEVLRRWLKQTTFPAGNRHGRALHSSRKLSLIDTDSFPKPGNLSSPFRGRWSFRSLFHCRTL